jgi:putative sigma-54 modulation protein
MKVTWTGRHMDLSPAQTQKLTAEFEKIGKILDNGKSEATAHVVLSHERHLSNVEIRVPYHDHELVGDGSDPDLFTAIHAAVAKLEKQAVKVRGKWRDSKRVPRKETDGSGETREGQAGGAETDVNTALSTGEEAGKTPVG